MSESAAASRTGFTPATFRIAGGLLLLAGLFRIVSYIGGFELAVAVSILEALALIGVFVTFLLAGFPHRGNVPRVLSIVLICVYGLSALALLAVMTPLFTSITGVLGLVVLGLGFTFGIVTLRTRGLPSSIAVLPFILYLGLFFLGLAVTRVKVEWSAFLPVFAYLVVGMLFIIFAGRVAPATTYTEPTPAPSA